LHFPIVADAGFQATLKFLLVDRARLHLDLGGSQASLDNRLRRAGCPPIGSDWSLPNCSGLIAYGISI
jgi:hypothetical protein